MAIFNPDHLFEQANALVASGSSGQKRQADLRRAISSAYYGLFHFTLTALADEFVGVSQRATQRYTQVYRSIDHRALRDLCGEIIKATPSARFARYVPPDGWGVDIEGFAITALDVQKQRLMADYDPALHVTLSDTRLIIESAQNAIDRFARAPREKQRTFLTCLLCPPR